MRLELTAFKALLEQNLPKVYQKLTNFGLPIELLIYRSLMSFYSGFFTSELVLRLWDIMVFFFSTVNAEERKRGVWWLITPAIVVLRESQEEILAA